VLLAAYGIKLGQRVGVQLRGRCPLPQHHSEQSRESFLVHTRKNVWICHSQSCVAARGGPAGGNVLDFVAAMEQCSILEAAHKLWAMGEGTGFEKNEGGDAFAGNSNWLAENQNPPLGFVLRPVDCGHSYLSQRGIDRPTAEYFQVGFYSRAGLMQGRIVIPLQDGQGRLVGYAGRAIHSDTPRYKFPTGFRKSLVLFNLHRVRGSGSRQAIVVEGFFDCLRVHQAGFPQVVALMGSSASAEQQEMLLAHFQELVVMLDGDEPGRRGRQRIVNHLGSAIPLRLAEVSSGRQPDQLAVAEIRRIIENALPVTR
jgi:DNA primase